MIDNKDLEWARPLQEMFVKQAPVHAGHHTEKGYRKDLGDRAMDTVEYARVERQRYVGEVGKRAGDYIYHFYAREKPFDEEFADRLGDAFLYTFLLKERLSWHHVQLVRCDEEGCSFKGTPEDLEDRTVFGKTRGVCPDCKSYNILPVMDSWSVRAVGFADNPMADELAARVFDALDKLLT